MARLLYTIAICAVLPFALARLWWRGRHNPGYRQHIAERFGMPAWPPLHDCLWIHAVSVGESMACAPIVEALRSYPEVALLITTTTPTGRAQIHRLFGDTATVSYLPWDLPWALARLFAHCRPRLLVLMETELWPNLIHQCARTGMPVALVNARLSKRSARRYQKLPALVRPMLGELALVAAQTDDDAARFARLGVPAGRLQVTGNVKFDRVPTTAERDAAAVLHRRWHAGHRLVWIAASVHRDEDEIVLDAFRRLRGSCPGVLLVLVPRHPERFVAAERLCQQRGLACARHSSAAPVGADVVIGDSMGELFTLFGAADIAFVGGSLVAVGGHNLLEPAVWGLPVLAGPNRYNFAEPARRLDASGALVVIGDAVELAAQVAALAGNEAHRQALGVAAATVAGHSSGAAQRVAALLDALLRADGAAH